MSSRRESDGFALGDFHRPASQNFSDATTAELMKHTRAEAGPPIARRELPPEIRRTLV